MSWLLVALALQVSAPRQNVSVPPAATHEAPGGQYPDPEIDAAVDAMNEWMDDPVLFVRQNFGVEPDEWQEDALCAIRDNKRVAMIACKGPGKSAVEAWAVWWFLATRPDAQVMVLSITGDNLRQNLWKELVTWARESTWLEQAFDIGATSIRYRGREDTYWVVARKFAQTADEEQQANTLAGFHGKHLMVVLDEVSDMPDGVVSAADGIFANVGAEAKLVIAGNPTRPEGPLYKAATRDSELWYRIHISGDPEDPKRSPRVSLEWANEQIKQYGREHPWVMVNILGLFPPVGSTKLIGFDHVLTAEKRDAKPSAYRSDALVWGIDPGYLGDDPSCLARRQGIVAYRFVQWKGVDGPELAASVSMLLHEAAKVGELPDAIFCDWGGIGASFVDHMKLLGWNDLLIPIYFGEKASDSRYYDKRTEMWSTMADWIKKRPSCLPTDPGLPAELTEPNIKWTQISRRTSMKLESKEDLRRRGVASPNKGDALALTFAQPVAAKRKRAWLAASSHQHQAARDYHKDPYSYAEQNREAINNYRDALLDGRDHGEET